MKKEEEIEISGIKYMPKSSVKIYTVMAKKLKGKPFVIVRTYSAGVFAGYLESRKGKEAVLLNSRRIWYWDGANSLSQLAMEGVTKPENCKFAMEVSRTELTEVIEVLEVTEKAKQCIDGVAEWKK